MRIIFMGTPDFAVESLKKLVENGQEVVAVVTMPDKAVGRHHEVLQASPVKQYAVAQGIPVLQPEKLKDEAFLEELRSYKADLQVVVAFRMLPEVVWAMPPMGTFNLHAALLPQYRGAAPINWAIINGETETGVTTFFLDHEIDTGRIIHRVPAPIADTDTAEDVHDRLMYLGADLVLQTVKDIEAGKVEAVEQEKFCHSDSECIVHSAGVHSDTFDDGVSKSKQSLCTMHSNTMHLKPAPKLFRENTQIRWHEHTVKSAYDFIRGLSPYPGAWTTLRTADGKETQLKVFFAEKQTPDSPSALPVREGAVTSDFVFPLLTRHSAPSLTGRAGGESLLLLRLSDGYLRLTDLQLAGKRRMKAEDFLRGAHLEDATLVEV